jgi:hypothetical protein
MEIRVITLSNLLDNAGFHSYRPEDQGKTFKRL